MQQQTRRGRVGAADVGDHVGPARCRLEQHRIQAGLAQPRRDVFGRGALVPVPASPVGRVEPDQIRGEPGHLLAGEGVRADLHDVASAAGRSGGSSSRSIFASASSSAAMPMGKVWK